MHIVGLLGMTRRIYTYSPDRGWDDLQPDRDDRRLRARRRARADRLQPVLEPAARRAGRSRSVPRRDARVDDPVAAAALQLRRHPARSRARTRTGTSRTASATGSRLASGEGMLDEGHETMVSSVKDGEFDAVLDMPAESAWPIVIALGVTVFFVLVLTSHYFGALAFAALVALAVGAWHWQEPEPSARARPRPRRTRAGRARPAGGAWSRFVATEATLFGSLIGAYVVSPLRARGLAARRDPRAEGRRAARPGRCAGGDERADGSSRPRRRSAASRRRAWKLIAIALAVQSAVFGLQLHRFADDLDRFAPQRDAYASIYYTLLGARPRAHRSRDCCSTPGSCCGSSSGLTRYRVVGVQLDRVLLARRQRPHRRRHGRAGLGRAVRRLSTATSARSSSSGSACSARRSRGRPSSSSGTE